MSTVPAVNNLDHKSQVGSTLLPLNSQECEELNELFEKTFSEFEAYISQFNLKNLKSPSNKVPKSKYAAKINPKTPVENPLLQDAPIPNQQLFTFLNNDDESSKLSIGSFSINNALSTFGRFNFGSTPDETYCAKTLKWIMEQPRSTEALKEKFRADNLFQDDRNMIIDYLEYIRGFADLLDLQDNTFVLAVMEKYHELQAEDPLIQS